MLVFAAERMFKDATVCPGIILDAESRRCSKPLCCPSPWHKLARGHAAAPAAFSRPPQPRCLGAGGLYVHCLHLSWSLFSTPTVMETLQKAKARQGPLLQRTSPLHLPLHAEEILFVF